MERWTVDRPAAIELGDVDMVRVRLVAGHVDVMGTDGPVRLEVHSVEGRPLDVRLESGELTVAYDELTWQGLLSWLHADRRSARISLAVPRRCPVELGVVSASAVVSGIAGPTSVRSVSGEVTLDGLAEAIDAQTVSGDLETRRLAGELRFQTVSGDLTVAEGISGALRAKTVSGNLTVDLDLAPDGELRLDSVSGDVTVRLPADAGLEVDVKSTSGDLGSAFAGLHHERRPGRVSLEGTVGDGRGRLRTRTVSGDVAVLRREPVTGPV